VSRLEKPNRDSRRVALGDPVSWLLIEKGWQVDAADGSDLGKVVAVTGDEEADIFDGLAVDSGFLDKPRYVPAEAVTTIEQQRVSLRLTRDKFEQLEIYEEPPPSIEIEPEQAPRSERMIESFFNFFRGFRRR
jgi:hypothetical protein